ncbi:hypothetical protein ACRALDRAFT_207101 [Sodiomyces alcalophilus JCM 7366]|uniref:uncharacterized protein n=1 Tax=Sodiomyces alcalophilus JCM 7366 TaxID=591952 RepID=UPI0039B565DC
MHCKTDSIMSTEDGDDECLVGVQILWYSAVMLSVWLIACTPRLHGQHHSPLVLMTRPMWVKCRSIVCKFWFDCGINLYRETRGHGAGMQDKRVYSMFADEMRNVSEEEKDKTIEQPVVRRQGNSVNFTDRSIVVASYRKHIILQKREQKDKYKNGPMGNKFGGHNCTDYLPELSVSRTFRLAKTPTLPVNSLRYLASYLG